MDHISHQSATCLKPSLEGDESVEHTSNADAEYGRQHAGTYLLLTLTNHRIHKTRILKVQKIQKVHLFRYGPQVCYIVHSPHIRYVVHTKRTKGQLMGSLFTVRNKLLNCRVQQGWALAEQQHAIKNRNKKRKKRTSSPSNVRPS